MVRLFTKLPALKMPAMSKASLHLPKLPSSGMSGGIPATKMPGLSSPKQISSSSVKPFSLSNFTKPPKVPVAPKMAIMKSAIKRVKPQGF